MAIASAIVWCVMMYGAIGLLFAGVFVWRGAGRLDPVARSGSVGFRLVIVPAAAALWPYLLVRWARARLSGQLGDAQGEHG